MKDQQTRAHDSYACMHEKDKQNQRHLHLILNEGIYKPVANGAALEVDVGTAGLIHGDDLCTHRRHVVTGCKIKHKKFKIRFAIRISFSLAAACKYQTRCDAIVLVVKMRGRLKNETYHMIHQGYRNPECRTEDAVRKTPPGTSTCHWRLRSRSSRNQYCTAQMTSRCRRVDQHREYSQMNSTSTGSTPEIHFWLSDKDHFPEIVRFNEVHKILVN